MESPAAMAMTFPEDATQLSCTPPTWLRKRLSAPRSPPLSTLQDIQAKLCDADLRRQKFYETLKRKAGAKHKNCGASVGGDNKGELLKAKVTAAEEKRLSILHNERVRLAKLDELRRSAKTEKEERFHKHCAELDAKVAERVRQAEANRLRILGAYRQRLATKKERTSKLLMQHLSRQRQYRERVRDAVHQKCAAAEKKRLRLLEAETMRARSCTLKVKKATDSLTYQQDSKRCQMQKRLEDRMQRARRKRAEYLRLRGRLHNCIVGDSTTLLQEQADNHATKIARCWRKFKKLRKTTAHLVEAYNGLNINERSVKAMTFDELALVIQSASTILTVQLFLDRLESYYKLSKSIESCVDPSSYNDIIDHLLKGLASPQVEERKAETHAQLSRYQARIMVVAYMMLIHPDGGENKMGLVKSAGILVQELELLVKILLSGPLLTVEHKSDQALVIRKTFRVELAAFDAAWWNFLNQLVAMDATLL